jgi:cytochrome c5
VSHPDTDIHAPKPDSFVNNFTVVLLLLVAFAFAIFYAAGIVASRSGADAPDPRLAALASERIRPVGQLSVGGTAGGGTAVAAAGEVNGEQVYNTACMACHATGAAGAPKHGNKDEWAPRIAQGKDVLYDHSIHGFKAMAPKGGFTNLSDDQVKAAVDYMVQAAQ